MIYVQIIFFGIRGYFEISKFGITGINCTSLTNMSLIEDKGPNFKYDSKGKHTCTPLVDENLL